VEAFSVTERFEEKVLSFLDPDYMQLEIITMAAPGGSPWLSGPVNAEHAIRGFHGISVSEEGYERTARLLSEVMGYKPAESERNRFRYRIANADNLAAVVDLLCVPDARHGRMGAGVVHHVAFRTPDDSQQGEWHRRIINLGFNVSPVMDRNYFHSIYFREPGGVLFEVATDNPGFTIDEEPEELGSRLKLPPQYEAHRIKIEQHLPPIKLPRW
jgi:catechol 2,3-dioxygenase-like lactoylglutathione lyase family enzyme